MISILFVFLWVAPDLEPVRWEQLALSIERDPSVSSDMVTLCRIRVVNNGRQTWAGHRLRFEARALRDGRVEARQRGRFGSTLGPHEILETVVAFTGIHERFEVSGVEKGVVGASERRARRGGKSGRKKRKR